MHLFPGEIGHADPMSFARLQERLLDRLRSSVREGTMTERGLARATGLSQPHVHNLLKGVRTPTIQSSDALLGALAPGAVAELFRFEHCDAAVEPSAGIPMLNGIAGPGWTWVDGCCDGEPGRFPCSAIAGLREPAALRVKADAAMTLTDRIVAVDRGWMDAGFPRIEDAYVVVLNGCGLVRWIRPGRRCLYLATNADLNRPAAWLRVSRDVRVAARIAGYDRAPATSW